MVDLSRLEAERQERGEGSDDEGVQQAGIKRFGAAAESGADSPVTPVPVGVDDVLTQPARARSGRSQSEQGQARAPLVSPLALQNWRAQHRSNVFPVPRNPRNRRRMPRITVYNTQHPPC